MPIRLLAFDLDGTLVQTERLKARSYALAARDLAGADTDGVEAAYADVVGQSRQQVARALVVRFGLASVAAEDGEAPWQALVRVRLAHYDALLADPDIIRDAAADRVLNALGLAGAFDAIVTADDVVQTKPDPEGYRLALAQTGTEPGDALAIEDSEAGVRAALAAGLRVVAVPTEITRPGIAEAAFERRDGVTISTRDGLVAAVRDALGEA